MLVEILIAVLLCAVYWYYNIRIPSAHRALKRVSIASESSVKGVRWDHVIIGGGVAGAAAARAAALQDPASRVLLIERGGIHSGGMIAAPAFTLDLIGTDVDAQHTAPRPFSSVEMQASPAEPRDAAETGNAEAKRSEQRVPYAVGRGLGGTQLLDWSLVFEPLCDVFRRRCPRSAYSHAVSVYEQMRQRHTSFAVLRSPLSWAFAEAVKLHASVVGCFLPSDSEVCDPNGEILPLLSTGHVSPHFLWLEKQYGTRPNLARYLLDQVPANRGGGPIAVMLNAVVVGLDREDNRVVAVVCRDPLGGAKRIAVAKSIVLCAGNFGSCYLAQRSSLLPRREWPALPLSDSISVPLIYQAKPGLSDDVVNAQSVRQIFAWYMARRGMLLNCVADTSMILPSTKVPGGSLLITLVPCGGYQAQRFQKMGLSRVLGVFQEAMHFQIAVFQLPTSEATHGGEQEPQFRDMASDAGSSGPGCRRAAGMTSITFETRESQRSLQILPLTSSASSSAHLEAIREMLVEGIVFCRELVTQGPLRALTTQKEAIDTSLFPDASEGKAAYRVLYGKLASAANQKQKQLDPKLIGRIRARAVEVATSESYLRQYVERHSRFVGFASGSLADAIEPHGMRLRGCDNVFVGDCSVVPTAAAFRDGLHRAASSSTAMFAGTVAGLEAATAAASQCLDSNASESTAIGSSLHIDGREKQE